MTKFDLLIVLDLLKAVTSTSKKPEVVSYPPLLVGLGLFKVIENGTSSFVLVIIIIISINPC